MARISFALTAAALLSLSIIPAACAQDGTPGSATQQPGDTTPPDELRELDLTGRDLAPPSLEPNEPVLESPFVQHGIMTPERLGELVELVDPDAERAGNGYIFKVQDRDLRLVYDENADRMRVITPIIPASDLPEELLERMLQANFDAVLDSRYAIGGGMVWSVFIHRLSSLTDEDLISGIAQAAIAADTFGTTFTSGAVVFGGGDTSEIHRDLERRLEEVLRSENQDRGI